ncbi:Leucine-rich repeat, immunoglobulin-like domain and transmembrane domain-containing protein 2 [Eumeta japonica]|uniref:Hemolin n=1 Tax=Eumeta variegata TaxID=151549 RepID=A0A4C1ZL09_EUMVA|nr:Leucine-rich repeat, immunoglobulin-like domain and transmembrane domain-containing protein 2 [Eumeta japonica]
MAETYWKKWLRYFLFTIAVLSKTCADFTTECQRPCDCRWQSGNKAAVCSNSSLKSIPANLSNDIQILDLSNNNLRQLHQEGFKKVGLSNLKKLFLKECNIETVHKAAFTTLTIMIELDLSRNKIRSLHPETFKGTEKLRLINLNNNLIEKLEDGLFRNLKYLQKVEASNNRIVRIATRAFTNLPQLKILRFNGNKLSHMKPEVLMSLSNLSGLDLHNNPWRCDCNLQTFRNWVISNNLYTPPTACAEPEALQGKLWNELDSTNFACRPTILEPLPDTTIKSYDENVTLTCKVVGNPTPEIMWKFNSKLIDLRPYGELKYIITDNSVDLIRWMNLTIINARYSDRGNYTCIAENPGGQDEKSVTLVHTRYSGVGFLANLDPDSFAILVGCLTAMMIIFGTVFIVCYCVSRKADNKRLIKTDHISPNGDALIEVSVDSEVEKGLVTEVNPVTKPPRKFEAPPSLTNEATEMSELNRTLIENESTKAAPNEDKSRDQGVEPVPKFCRETLQIDRLTQEHQAYPPDLLTFPLRGTAQVSPAASGTSSGQERPKSNHTDSPLKTPEYGYEIINSGLLSRFQNTTEGSIPLLNSRSGYVTLPRRPRVPSWLPENSNIYPQVFSSINGVIPYYDNIGTKFFGHGVNYYNLNKSEMDLGPINGKIINSYRIPHSNTNISQDIEPAPSPAPGTPHATIPRSSLSSPNIHNQLLALQMVMDPAFSSRISSKNALLQESKPLKIMFTPSENESVLKNLSRDNFRAGSSANALSVTSARTRSVQKQPLKSKKRNSSELKEPFLVNAGDTATQV